MNKIKPWILAARPKTLFASLSPIIIGLSFYGMYKYPTPPHIYDYYTTPDYRFSDIATSDDCECGNDPSCRPMWWWHDQKQVEEKYRYYV